MTNVLVLWIAFILMVSPIEAQDIEWGTLHTGKLENDLQVPGHVIPQEGALSVESARIQGRITDLFKREGEDVQAGDALFGVNSAECISLAEELRVAQSRQIPDLISASVERERQLALRVTPEACDILATYAGTLIKRQVDLGGSFNAGDSLATILDVHRLSVELDVSERDLASVRVGQAVTLEVASHPNRPLRSVVAHILPTIDPTTRTTKVRLGPVALPEGTTLDALVFGRIHVGSGEQIFEVPTTALVFYHNRQYVIKKSEPPVAVPVAVLNETQTTSSILAIPSTALTSADHIATVGAIYLFKDSHPSPS